MEQRKELVYERHPLSGRFWEPEPDEEDLKRMMQEADGNDQEAEELPFE